MKSSAFFIVCRGMGIGEPTQEYRFCQGRKWRFDYAWPTNRVALEIEGGAWVGGRHNRAASFIREMEKYNRAAALGWRVLRCTPQQLANGDILTDLADAVAWEQNKEIPT